MEHEKLPGSTEGELLEFEWWMPLLDATIIIYAFWSGSIFWLMIGIYLTGKKKKEGWLFMLAAASVYIILGAMSQLYFFGGVSIIVAVMHLKNYISWRKE